MATQIFWSIIDIAKATRRTAILPLYDVKNACYEVIREMVLPLGTDETELMNKLHTYGISQCLVGAVDMLLQKPALTDGTCPAHLLSPQAQAHLDTSSQVKEIPHVARATTGSRPGTSLADVMFEMLCAKTLTTVPNSMLDQGVLLDLTDFNHAGVVYNLEGPLPAADATCADDSGFFTIAKDNRNMPGVIAKVVRSMRQVLRQRALAPSCEAGKSGIGQHQR